MRNYNYPRLYVCFITEYFLDIYNMYNTVAKK